VVILKVKNEGFSLRFLGVLGVLGGWFKKKLKNLPKQG